MAGAAAAASAAAAAAAAAVRGLQHGATVSFVDVFDGCGHGGAARHLWVLPILDGRKCSVRRNDVF